MNCNTINCKICAKMNNEKLVLGQGHPTTLPEGFEGLRRVVDHIKKHLPPSNGPEFLEVSHSEPSYHQRFRDWMKGHSTWQGGISSNIVPDLLAFIDEVVAEKAEEWGRMEHKSGYYKGRLE